ncbi:uncharacterized protein LOC135222869 [Macrobrachium nipponense]|uniref:uncharacterized protein LOC135222869 n=1 Tax=Macrobrachium nipponense TaxID=159736 RepID=UPI0030C8846F
MKKKVFLVVSLVLCVTQSSAAPKVENQQQESQPSKEEMEAEITQSERDDKLFVALVQVSPDECDAGDGKLGTCMPSYECTKRGGVSSGGCAKAFGTCCLVERTCNSETSLNNTYFVNPSSETETEGACILTVNRATPNICQIRLDFETFQISQPDDNGHCSDFFMASGVNMPPNTICGKIDGQHMYLDVAPNGGAIKLTVDRQTLTANNKNWNIKVTQISCDSKYKAPESCLQYYTSTSGTVQSFNFATNNNQVTQLANQNYGVCIRKAPGYCGIIWERDNTTNLGFTMSGAVDAVFPDLLGQPSVADFNGDCLSDYVVIPEGVTDLSEQHDRFCGLGFPKWVMSTATPFVLYVRTDSAETVDGSNLGFSLTYRQTNSC